LHKKAQALGLSDLELDAVFLKVSDVLSAMYKKSTSRKYLNVNETCAYRQKAPTIHFVFHEE
jgi:hypothetical protein